MTGQRGDRSKSWMNVSVCVLWQDRPECIYKLRQESAQREEMKIYERVTMTNEIRSWKEENWEGIFYSPRTLARKSMNQEVKRGCICLDEVGSKCREHLGLATQQPYHLLSVTKPWFPLESHSFPSKLCDSGVELTIQSWPKWNITFHHF